MPLPNLYCFLWKLADETYVYTVEEHSLLMALFELIRHCPDWANFKFRALEDYLIHPDDKVQMPELFGNRIMAYYLL